jgi:hypothetical protein
MSKTDDGGPAFPNVAVGAAGTVMEGDPGMSLRDHFAAMAMQGLIAAGARQDYAALAEASGSENLSHDIDACLAFNAYRIAEAMITRREKP